MDDAGVNAGTEGKSGILQGLLVVLKIEWGLIWQLALRLNRRRMVTSSDILAHL